MNIKSSNLMYSRGYICANLESATALSDMVAKLISINYNVCKIVPKSIHSCASVFLSNQAQMAGKYIGYVASFFH